MAQVYRFTDENGQVRLFAEIEPSPVFNGGTITGQLDLEYGGAVSAAPLKVVGVVGQTPAADWTLVEVRDGLAGLRFVVESNGATTVLIDGANGGSFVVANSAGAPYAGVQTNGVMFGNDGFRTAVITAGALPTAAFVSGTARQLSTTRDVNAVVPFTGDATNNAATLLIELSPDNVTFSTLDTLSIAAALNLTGALNVPVSLQVPAAWYVKLTAAHGTIGTATYY